MDNKTYKNAPLIETVFEIRFPGEPAIECQRDKFYDKVRKNYPKVFVPKSESEKAMSLEPYRFENEDETSGIMISLNKFGIYNKKYEGFNLFKKEVIKISKIFGDLFKINKLNRIGLRYINVIPFMREDSIIPINDYLTINIGLPESVPTNFKNLKLVFVSQIKEGNITTRIEPAIKDETQEVIILDFDYSKENNLTFMSLSKYLDESHRYTKLFFEELITDKYKKIIKGEVIS